MRLVNTWAIRMVVGMTGHHVQDRLMDFLAGSIQANWTAHTLEYLHQEADQAFVHRHGMIGRFVQEALMAF